MDQTIHLEEAGW